MKEPTEEAATRLMKEGREYGRVKAQEYGLEDAMYVYLSFATLASEAAREAKMPVKLFIDILLGAAGISTLSLQVLPPEPSKEEPLN